MSNIQVPLEDGSTLVVNSNWDSGVHHNFQAGVMVAGKNYHAASLEKHLSKAQIHVLECILASHIKTMLEDN